MSLSLSQHVCMYIYIYIYIWRTRGRRPPCDGWRSAWSCGQHTPNLPTKMIPTKIAWLELSGKSPMDMRIPSFRIKIMFESNPLKSIMFVGRLAVSLTFGGFRGFANQQKLSLVTTEQWINAKHSDFMDGSREPESVGEGVSERRGRGRRKRWRGQTIPFNWGASPCRVRERERESREQRADSREQRRADSREHRAREQRAESQRAREP